MKARLDFDLDDEMDRYYFRAAVDAMRWKRAAHEMCEYLRQQVKYADPPADADEIRAEMYRIYGSEGLDLNE